MDPIYVDTSVLVDAFLDDVANHPLDPTLSPPELARRQKKHAKILAAKDLFTRYDGPNLITSPFALAEFVLTATRRNGMFNMTEAQAKQHVETLVAQERMNLCVPIVELHEQPRLQLPFLQYSLRLDGQARFDNGRTAEGMLIFGQGAMVRSGFAGGLPLLSADEIYQRTHWHSVTLSSALYHLFLDGAIDATASAVQGTHKLQDALVLMFARGLDHVDFITSDEGLATRSGQHPFADVRVYLVDDYLAQELRVGHADAVDGSWRN